MSVSSYEKRFQYIENRVLRRHMGDVLEFIANILAIADQYSEDEKNHFYKTCILYTASLIESHIHHALLQLFGNIEMERNEREYDVKKIHALPDGSCLFCETRTKRPLL